MGILTNIFAVLKDQCMKYLWKHMVLSQKNENSSMDPNTSLFIKEKEWPHKICLFFISKYTENFLNVESFECVVSVGLATLKSKLILSSSSPEPLSEF